MQVANVDVENFYGRQGPTKSFWFGAKTGTYLNCPGGWVPWSRAAPAKCSLPTSSSSTWVSSFLLFFFTLFIRTVNQAVLTRPLAIVHIYVPEKNGFSCLSSSHAWRCSHSLLQRARRAFRHLQPRSSNGISAILSERGTALLHWQSSGRGGFWRPVSVGRSRDAKCL